MSAARPLPELGSIFLDARGSDRALRVSWHTESDLVVLSLWRDNVCAASFRLAVDEVPELIEMLRAGLDRAYDGARRPSSPDPPAESALVLSGNRRAGVTDAVTPTRLVLVSRNADRNPLDGPIRS